MDVADWLRKLGLEQYEATFRQNDVSAELLPNLTAEDLKDLGITSVGHRRRLLEAIAALRTNATPAVDIVQITQEPAAGPIHHPRSTESTAERRQLTVVFCDLVGSTALSSRLDPEDLREVIAAYHRAVDEVVARSDGFVAKYMGDGVLAYFGYPRAHEDDAERAVRAGLGVIDAVGRLDVKSAQLHARVGIATGLVIVGDLIGEGAAQEQSVVGETPNLAARLQALAEPNAVIIDSVTRTQIGRLLECRDLGAVTLKGLPEPVRIWRVLPEEPTQNRFEALRPARLSPLVGREAELDYLLQRWRKARSGEGGAVIVSGDAGIGKSRLIAALEEKLEDEAPTWLRYFCSPHHTDTPLHPVITALRHEAGFDHRDTNARRLHKLRLALAPTTSAPADIALIAELLSIPLHDHHPILDASPQVRKERTFAALVSRLRLVALTNPALVILEDAHWADPSSIELFDAMLSALPEIPALLVISMRDEDSPASVRWDGIGTLRLPHLDRQQAAELAASVRTDAILPPALLERIVDQTDGVPLFVEELTKNVMETASGGKLGGADFTSLAVPATLQASLMARLDRITAAKAVAQIGAVFGREFSHSLLSAIANLSEPALVHGLQQLVEAGLASRRGTPPDVTYTFKHALIRDTAYGMLLRSRRRELHAHAAAALEDLSPELIEQQPELFAHHYTLAGLVEPAIAFWVKAGRRSVARSAMIEAAAQLRQALELLPELPEGPARLRQELELQSMLGGVLFASQAWAGGWAVQAYARAQELAEQLGDVEATIRVLAGLVTYHIGKCQYRDAGEIAVKLLEIAEREKTSSVKLIAHRCMGVTLHWTGEFAGALDHFDRVLSLYDPARDRQLATVVGFDVGVQAAFLSCWDLLILGRLDQALERFALAREQLREVNHKHSLVLALCYGGIFSLFMQDQERAFHQLTEAFELANDQQFAAWIGISNIVLGSVFSTKDNGARGLAQTRGGYAKYIAANGASETGIPLVLNVTYYLALLARAYEAAGESAESLAHLEAAIDAAERTGERWFEPELHRLKGEWLLRHAPGCEVQAEPAFAHAINRATQQKARFWQLRAAVSLAKLYVVRGHPGRARATLSPVFGRFSECVDWPDLRQAEALLASLPP
jgi:class 3 adenylate cyclase/tetratricopeptide (TPR) repeat protein